MNCPDAQYKPNSESFQHSNPCFIGDPIYLRTRLGLKVGFASWNDLEAAQQDCSGNACYFGQISSFLDSETKQKVVLPHGFGAVFLRNGEPLICGQFDKGTICDYQKAKVFTGNDSIGNEQQLWFSPDGDLYLVAFKDGVPKGPGIKVDKKGNALFGHFENGLLNGHGIIELFYGASWEGSLVDDQPTGIGTFVYSQLTGKLNKQKWCSLKVNGSSISDSSVAVDSFDNRFIGKFDKGSLNGQGLVLTHSNMAIEAVFSNNEIIKLLSFVSFDGDQLHATLLNDTVRGTGYFIDKEANVYKGTVSGKHKRYWDQVWKIAVDKKQTEKRREERLEKSPQFSTVSRLISYRSPSWGDTSSVIDHCPNYQGRLARERLNLFSPLGEEV